MSSESDAANTEPEVLVEQRDRILIITINRPKAKNAVNAAVSRGLADAMDQLDGDAGLSVAILTGGGGSFCAGMASRRSPGARMSSSKVAALALPNVRRPSRSLLRWKATRWRVAPSWRLLPT